MDDIDREYLNMFKQQQDIKLSDNISEIEQLKDAIERSLSGEGRYLTPTTIGLFKDKIKQLQKEVQLAQSGNTVDDVVPNFYVKTINNAKNYLEDFNNKIQELKNILMYLDAAKRAILQTRKQSKINCKEADRIIQKISNAKKWLQQYK